MSATPSLAVLCVPAAADPLSEALASFYARCNARGLAPRTVEFYSLRLERFRRFLAERVPEAGPAEVTAAIIRQFLEAERARKSAASASKARTCLSALFAYLTREELVAVNPMERVERVKAPEKVVRPLSEDEIARLLEAGSPRTFLGARLRALVLLLVDTGLRVGECCGLDLADVDLGAGLVTVRHTKNGRERQVPFGEAVRRALRVYLAKRGDLATAAVFVTHYGDRMGRYTVAKALRNGGERAGVANAHPHRLRHSAATLALRGGMHLFSLQAMLGHSSLAMVKRYAQMVQADLVEQHRQASPGDRFLSAIAKGGARRRLR